jgi:hypothetical protein
MAKTYAEELVSARLMLSGIKANTERLGKRGIDAAFITEFETAINEATALDAEQEVLMARRKEKTAALQEKINVIAKMNIIGKRMVKTDYAKESWREFGIMDQQ